MPTFMSSEIPRPKSWEEFEHVTLDSLRIKWCSPNLVRNGRPGQKQDGVDIHGPDHLEQDAGAQCKNTYDNLTLAIIKKEIEMAEAFKPPLAVLYIATTCLNDAKLQKSVRLLSAERVKAKKFPVWIFFWEDIVRDLAKNPECMWLHYPHLNPAACEDKLK